MKNFRVLGVLFALMVVGFTINAQTLSSTQTIYPHRVEVLISNSGNTSTNTSYIIIQDDVLPLTEGTISVPANGSTLIEVYCTNADQHYYSVQCNNEPIPLTWIWTFLIQAML